MLNASCVGVSSGEIGMITRSGPWSSAEKGFWRPTMRETCIIFERSLLEMYSSAGSKFEGKVSKSKERSGESGGDIISVVILNSPLGIWSADGRGNRRTPMAIEEMGQEGESINQLSHEQRQIEGVNRKPLRTNLED